MATIDPKQYLADNEAYANSPEGRLSLHAESVNELASQQGFPPYFVEEDGRWVVHPWHVSAAMKYPESIPEDANEGASWPDTLPEGWTL